MERRATRVLHFVDTQLTFALMTATAAEPESSRRGPRQVTDEHKAALARGREEGRIVRVYLDALRQRTPLRPGRKRDPERARTRLDVIAAELERTDLDTLARLRLVQERIDVTTFLANGHADEAPSLDEAEAAFVAVAKDYSTRFRLSHAAWVAVGVPKDVLTRAGIHK